MAQAIQLDSSIPKFDCKGDTTSLAQRWKRWKRSLEYYITSRGLKDAAQKKALLLHHGGMDMQDLFENLADPGVPEGQNDDADVYQKAVRTFDAHFILASNVTFERHKFRQMSQEDTKNIDQFIARLSNQAGSCSFTDSDEQIKDQVVDKCHNSRLRRKLLEQSNLNLKRVQEVARAMEAVDLQAKEMEVREIRSMKTLVEVNSVSSFHGSRTGACYRCGKQGHWGRDKECPAKSAKCDVCHKVGHFSSRCHTKNPDRKSSDRKSYDRKSHDKRSPDKKFRSYKKKVHCVAEEPEYTFNVNSIDDNADYVTLELGGVPLKLMVDSGSQSNIVDAKTWEDLKSQRIRCTTKTDVNKQLYAYGQPEPLPTKGLFVCTVKVDDEVLDDTEFIVMHGRGPALLGRSTAKRLGLLKVSPTVNVVGAVSHVPGHILEKFPSVFCGIGKLKDRQVKIHVKPDADPVAQPLRRTPYQLRAKVEAKVKELLQADIIEAVDTPSSWVNPVVIVPKANGEIRLCVDMRRANEAIQRVRHPIPTVDELLQSMNGSTVFSKLDLKWGYHQIELDPESRDITTFVTSAGLFRYKRLFFGVNSATEQYQHEIQRVLSGLRGAANISDDIIVHGRNQEEHDKNLMAAMSRVQDSMLTLNPGNASSTCHVWCSWGCYCQSKGSA